MKNEEFKRSEKEKSDLEKVRKIADKWGYGNLIHFIHNEWAEYFIRKGFKPKLAASMTWMDEEEQKLFIKSRKKKDSDDTGN